MQVSRLTIPGLIAIMATAIGIADWPTLVFLVGLTACVCTVVWLGNRMFERDLAEMKRGIQAVMRAHALEVSAPRAGSAAPLPLSGDRAGGGALSCSASPCPLPQACTQPRQGLVQRDPSGRGCPPTGRARWAPPRHAMTDQPTRGPVADYQWRVSEYGPWAHAFVVLGAVFSEAICSQCSLTEGLQEDEYAVRCPGCLTVIGEGLADKLGDRHPLD